MSSRRASTTFLSSEVMLERRSIWTRNAVPGQRVYGESTKHIKGSEFRKWDPYRSKLGAALLRTQQSPAQLLPQQGESILYLGAGHGTSVSHLYDHLCGANNAHGGRLICIDLSPRCLRNLTLHAVKRPGLVPILGDARQFGAWGMMVSTRVPWLFQDVAQAGQVEIFIRACQRFLNVGGMGLLSLKAASERWTGQGERQLFHDAAMKLKEANFRLIEEIELTGFEDQHHLFVVEWMGMSDA